MTEDEADSAINSPAPGALTSELRRAEANHYDVEPLLPRLVQARAFTDVDDITAVLSTTASPAPPPGPPGPGVQGRHRA